MKAIFLCFLLLHFVHSHLDFRLEILDIYTKVFITFIHFTNKKYVNQKVSGTYLVEVSENVVLN
jgi:hypothetical protein